MKYDQVKQLSAANFRRLTGVRPDTFKHMLEILEAAEATRKAHQKHRGGRKPTLTIPDKLLLTLEYLREYRTQFHIGQSYGVSESVAGTIIRWVEDTLMQSGAFALPGKRELLKSDVEYTMVVIDATETPIERPKKNRNVSTPERKKDIR